MARPSNFRPEFVEQAAKLCRLGATDIEIADFFEVSVATVYRWKNRHSEFCEALKVGKESADNRVERSLFFKATGYTYDSVKIFQEKGQPVIVPYREHVPPDTTAAIFWLKNRKPHDWRDRHEIDHRIGATAADDATLLAIALGRGGDPAQAEAGTAGPADVVPDRT